MLSFMELFHSTTIMSLSCTTISGIKSTLSLIASHKSVHIPKDEDPNLVDLFTKILDKDPATRIKMPQLRVNPFSNHVKSQEHPWVTANGQDPLLSTEENTAEMVTQVTEKDYAEAIKGIRGVVHVVSRAFAHTITSVSCSTQTQSSPPREPQCPKPIWRKINKFLPSTH